MTVGNVKLHEYESVANGVHESLVDLRQYLKCREKTLNVIVYFKGKSIFGSLS